MNYFICDIVGTFDGCDNNREESILKFINNLHRMMEIDGIDSLTFCFSSSSEFNFSSIKLILLQNSFTFSKDPFTVQ